jgi:MoaA/NifB/PqqE/SkfB family radical SAM enzyme
MKTILSTNICNNNCLMCPSQTGHYRISEDKVRRIMSNNTNICDDVVVTGGEPTTHINLTRIIDLIYQLNNKTIITIVTNGRRFHYKHYVKKFVGFPRDKLVFQISLTGHSPELHDKITQVNGSFDQTITGIKNLLYHGFEVQIITVVHALNYRYLASIVKLIDTSLKGTKAIRFYSMLMQNNSLLNIDELKISFNQIQPYLYDAVDKSNVDIELLYFPYCVLDIKYHYLVKGYGDNDQHTEEFMRDSRAKYPSVKCLDCYLYSKCRGIWYTYPIYMGDNEFIPYSNK